ncbi:hypothetical protein [Sphingomonas sanguinis]|uniref:RelA/SpoT domain-containing protein n=1 Tax=Sphingomonas sanguinis TaxID=33051 RepID=A0A147HST1_9SPHN|nr:hypothetical protein [Sphingomonas sanguinis]KTT67904.1 hypothetical protein NS319_16295 [Sphingomonas sanguinis]
MTSKASGEQEGKGNITESSSITQITGDERLLLEVVEALRGADNLRDRLLMALQTGTPAVADLAYAVKARVKEDHKVIEKIKDRRSGGKDRDPKPDYGVSDVTDLVGLRIVTLYRLDVIEVIEALLRAIDQDPSSAAAFVAGSISEVVIYSTNPTGDVQDLPNRVMRLFEDYGLGSPICRIAEKPSNYSSIHILVRGRGKYRDGYRELPVEIQVRTALEDVWGQIEHSLKYKRKQLVSDNSPENARLTITLNHLGALKTMIDGIAQYGDQIKLQIDELEPELRYTASRHAEEPSARLAKIRDLPAQLRAEIADAIAQARPVLSTSTEPTSSRIRVLRLVLSRLERAKARVLATSDLQPKPLKEARYLIDMQLALIHFQLGNLLEEGEVELRRALDIYSEVEEVFPKRVIVQFRLARTLDALGARDEAIAKMREVVERLRLRAEPTPQNHWIRSTAPRSLGVMLWEEAKVRRERASSDAQADARTLELLREAFQLTSRAHEQDVFDEPTNKGPSERVRAANNLLYFLLEYLDAGGEPMPGMEEADVRVLLQEIGAEHPEQIGQLAAADTARRAYAHVGDRARETEAARTVLRLSRETGAPRTSVVRDAIRAAERTINLPTHGEGT